MSSSSLRIRKAAVLGAGVMGAQIAAHLANAGVETVLFDLPAKDGDPNGIVLKAIENLKKLSPAPLADKSRVASIIPANYDKNLEWLKSCDLVIEAIAERLDWKRDLYAKIAPFIGENAVLASNTSGLSINALADVLSVHLHERFCGVHFFNPPRYMHLVELIPCAKTSEAVLVVLEAFLTTALGKGVGLCPRHTELHRQPHLCSRCWQRCITPSSSSLVSMYRRTDWPRNRQAEECDASHCRRGWSGHHGACHQNDG